MRQVGTLPNETQARRLVDYLTTQEIESRAEAEDGGWAIWVMDEDQFEQAQDEYQSFRDHPDDPRYTDVADEAQRKRRERAEKQRAAAKNVVEMRGQWNRGMTRRAPATFLLIAACVVVFMMTHMGSKELSDLTYRTLAFRDPAVTSEQDPAPSAYRDIKRGEIWRLASTMLLHAGIMHIFFNMYMLYYFGGQMESRKGWPLFVAFVLLASTLATLAQVALTGPNVVGMSGVVYALFGYIWMKARFDPKSGFFIGQFTVILLIGWFFAGFLDWGMFRNIANGAHGAGLLFGVVLGYLPELVPQLRNIL